MQISTCPVISGERGTLTDHHRMHALQKTSPLRPSSFLAPCWGRWRSFTLDASGASRLLARKPTRLSGVRLDVHGATPGAPAQS